MIKKDSGALLYIPAQLAFAVDITFVTVGLVVLAGICVVLFRRAATEKMRRRVEIRKPKVESADEREAQGHRAFE